MNDKKYFDNIHRIEEIVSRLDSGKLAPNEAKKLFEIGKDLFEDCESILIRYSGTVEERSFIALGD